MRHEDFTNLNIESVMAKVLDFSLSSTNAKAVHWLSSTGLARVHEISNENWTWAFSTADVIGKHVISRPAADLSVLFSVWQQVANQYIQPTKVVNKAGARPGPTSIVQPLPSNFVAYPMAYNGVLVGILLFEGVAAVSIREELEIASKYVAFAYQLYEAKTLSYKDELTGLYNQRYLPLVLDHEIERARREKAEFSLLFLDIDYFKTVNDGRGHWVGSKLLIELGEVLQKQVRSCDYAFRYGGDEFIILLGGSGAESSKLVAERIRKAVESHVFEIESQKLKLTVSIGLASYPDHAKTASDLIQIADQAMYHGKRKSRNIVFVAS